MLTKCQLIYVAALLICCTPGWAQHEQPGGLVRAPDTGTFASLPKPSLLAQGGALILSDSPEQIHPDTEIPAALYRDQVTGLFRVFYHHQNVSGRDISAGVAITNTTPHAEALFSIGKGGGVHRDPAIAGQKALAAFLATHTTLQFVTMIAPGHSFISTQRDTNGDTASGFEEYISLSVEDTTAHTNPPAELTALLSSKLNTGAKHEELTSVLPSGYGTGTVIVTTFISRGKIPDQPASLPILAGDEHVRGTFPHFDRYGAFTLSGTDRLQALDISTGAPGHPYANDLPGEYELGIDTVDGRKRVYNDGNYGVLYTLSILVDNHVPFSESPLGILMRPTGGSGAFVMSVDGKLLLSPYADSPSAWWFGQCTAPIRGASIKLQTSLTGGSSGPQQLLFAPGFKGHFVSSRRK